ncbi:FAD-binding domain-containing protein [Pleomassaria siparia CBS 279.74]|uniref:FAD-binding domain-containing protein n=1 Tax=Pleomassaria siparia CBS 279.74 TaxID=1314801 RepID=A0A6G1JXK0_9PLEO|nr:FAD-binding domain-containing protein [Pleomassaria siparia CBS 279.74]
MLGRMLPSTSVCGQLNTIANLALAFPNSASYNATEKAYWSLQEASLTPSCIAQPSTSQHVADIVSTIVSHGCTFAIKGQGHAPSAGFANINDGVTIDMTGLHTISVNEDASVASVGAGASWLDVYTFLDPLNKTVAGGRNGAVGVGGLTLGGGISYFSPQVGFTCDTVINFEVVLASGHVIDANGTSHTDLFRALKGGMNNFGVVTRFDFSTLPIGEILGGGIANDISDRHAVFEALANIANAPEYDVYTSIVTSIVFSSSSKSWTLASAPIYAKPNPNPPVYRELFAVPSISNTMHLTSLHAFANETATPQINFLFYTTTFGVSADLLERILQIANASLHDLEIPGVTWLFALEPLPTVLVQRGAGDNSLGTSAQDGNSIVLLLTAVWTDSSYSEGIDAKSADVIAGIEEAARDMGLGRRFRYANYANAKQRVVDSYGVENRMFLEEVAQKYDPEGVFQKLVPGGFKLGD